MPVRGGYLALAGGGAILLWSGLKGKSWSQVLRAIMAGKAPETATTAYTIQGSPYLGTRPGGTGLGGLIVSNARANPLPYQWAGIPANGVADCSSWCNWIIGHITGLAIPMTPPGGYAGTSHGPATEVWAIWTGCFNVSRAQMQPGDLVIWPAAHMGIVTGPEQMISDLNPALGVRETPINQGPGPGYLIRRLKAVG